MLAARNPNVARAPKPSKVPSTPWSSIVKKGAAAAAAPPCGCPNSSSRLSSRMHGLHFLASVRICRRAVAGWPFWLMSMIVDAERTIK